ncbi:Rieske (2Fe-2S) protein [Propylenella binzhouense]|uniref:Rieske (2Fe-2S) protein n=1 Tax=Propylenella binzhouense TaxID=2555902 RepID=A0A964T0Z5_9HYPH|nr:Rieske (2Fe-2S) protein [Propylenella binzhouense]MYZ46351.1 Rieske (2Fe-2S) protein [Propylenella binzhouense]
MRYYVAEESEIGDGERRVVSCDGKEIGVFRVKGRLFAWHNRCVHQNGPVCQGRIYNRVVEPVAEDGTTRFQEYDAETFHLVCPWHGYEYDIETGQHPGNPRVRLRAAKLEIEDGSIYVSA